LQICMRWNCATTVFTICALIVFITVDLRKSLMKPKHWKKRVNTYKPKYCMKKLYLWLVESITKL